MRQAILLVGHGSREAEGNAELLAFADRMKDRLAERYPIVEACFLEFASPTIGQGIDRCVEKGATHVTLVPIILFAAGHSKLHIPHEMDAARHKYPAVRFAYGKPIGVHPYTLEILSERLAEASFRGEKGGLRQEAAVLLVGRGSSDPDANSDLCKVARLLWEQVPVQAVETCFIGVTEPNFAEGMRRCVNLGVKRVYVLPYFLFTGVLIKRIDNMMQEFSAMYPDLELHLAGYFGFHDRLIDILEQRVQEAAGGEVKMNCDLCQYRLEAMTGHEHEHEHQHEHSQDTISTTQKEVLS